MNTFASLLLVVAVLPCIIGTELTAERGGDYLYEEDSENFPRQKARAAVNITGRVYVKTMNFNLTANVSCLFSEHIETISKTNYTFTLGALWPQNETHLLTFNTSVILSKTGKHPRYNGLTYKFSPEQRPELRKVMYINKNKTCLVLVNNRNTSTDPTKCQLLLPAAYANDPAPKDCQHVFEENCPGETLSPYEPSCQDLPTVPMAEILAATAAQ